MSNDFESFENIINKLTVGEFKALIMFSRGEDTVNISEETGLTESDLVFLVSNKDNERLIKAIKDGFSDKILRKTVLSQMSQRWGLQLLIDSMDPEIMKKTRMKDKLEIFREVTKLLQIEEKEDKSSQKDITMIIHHRLRNDNNIKNLIGKPKEFTEDIEEIIEAEYTVKDENNNGETGKKKKDNKE